MTVSVFLNHSNLSSRPSHVHVQMEFCWVCSGPWAPHGSSWYNCNRFDPKKVEEDRDSTNVRSVWVALLHCACFCSPLYMFGISNLSTIIVHAWYLQSLYHHCTCLISQIFIPSLYMLGISNLYTIIVHAWYLQSLYHHCTCLVSPIFIPSL